MPTSAKTVITVEAIVNAPVEKVWKFWNDPKHITKWNNASDDWHSPFAENEIKSGGKFKYTMAAKDGSMSFDFEGVYSKVEENRLIEYTIADGRNVSVKFSEQNGQTKIVETFEAESTHPIGMQRGGWQAILDNFKKYTEAD